VRLATNDTFDLKLRTEVTSNPRRDQATPKFYKPLHDAVIRVYDSAGNVIDTHEYKGGFKEP